MTLIVERAHQVVEDLAHARSRRAFLAALDHFERMLALAPDYPPGVLGEADTQALSALADSVLSHIEDRLERRTDRAAVQRTLVIEIYKIRRGIETLHALNQGAELAAVR